MSSSTPNSSVSNMACLPEDPELVAFGEDHTGAPVTATVISPAQIRLNSSSTTSSSCTPSPPNLLPVSQPKVPNLRRGIATSPTKNNQTLRPMVSPTANGSGDGAFNNSESNFVCFGSKLKSDLLNPFSAMPNLSSFGSPSVLGVGGPLYNPHQNLNRINNNPTPNARYAPLGINPAVSVNPTQNNPTYSTVNKTGSSGDGPKVSSMGTHV